MATVNVKYIKDETGSIISPVTSYKSIYSNNLNNIDVCVNGETIYSGNSSGTITLTKSCTNYNRLTVIFNYGTIYSQVYLTNPNNKSISIAVHFSIGQYNVARTQYKVLKFKDSTISVESAGYLAISESQTIGASSSENQIYISQVIGYKN